MFFASLLLLIYDKYSSSMHTHLLLQDCRGGPTAQEVMTLVISVGMLASGAF